MHHGVTFNFKSVHLPYLRDVSLMTKIYGLLQLIRYVLLHNCVIKFPLTAILHKFYSFIIFGLLINAVILLLNCLVLILYFTYISFILDIIFCTQILFGPLYN